VSDIEETYSEKVVTKTRTYYFTVRQSKGGGKELVISQVPTTGGAAKLSEVKLVISSSDLGRFKFAIEKAAEFVERFCEEKKRRHYGAYNAGNPWSPEEDRRLLSESDSGMSISEIAAAHGRTKGAIESRLTLHEKVQPHRVN
jgi:hypothetical protein